MRHARTLAIVLPLLATSALARADGEPAPNPPAAAAASEDVLSLKDGRRVAGEIVAEDERFVTLRAGGTTRAYARDTIASVERAARPAAGAPPAAPAPSAEPSGKEPSKDGKKGKGERREPPLSDTARVWLKDLLVKSADADEGVRRSVAAAIGALGPQAVPAVREAQAAATDPGQKQFLERIANEIEMRRDRKMRGEPPMPGDGMMPEPGGPPRMPQGRRAVEQMMQRVSEELELRDEQKPKVETILVDWMKKRGELGRQAQRDGLTAEQVAEKVAPLRAELLTQMKAVLDEPQYVMFEEYSQRLAEMPRGPMPPMPPKPAEPAPGEPPK